MRCSARDLARVPTAGWAVSPATTIPLPCVEEPRPAGWPALASGAPASTAARAAGTMGGEGGAGAAGTAPSAASCAVRGGRKRALIWTGPGSRLRVPAAATTARRTCPAMAASAAQPPRSAARSAGRSTPRRRAGAKSPVCSVVWLAPVPTSSWGRSALMTSRGIPAASASLTAGWRLETAVPEVVTTAAQRLCPFRAWARAAPRAMKPALRSSRTTRSRRRPASAASARASASGALRDPGHRTTSRTPSARRAATRLRASAMAGGSCGRSGESVTGARIRERPACAALRLVTVR